MRVGTRLLLLKLALAAALLAAVLAALHLLLPGLAPPGRKAGDPAIVVQAGAVRIAVPRHGGALATGSGFARQVGAEFDAFLQALAAEVGPTLGLAPPERPVDVHVFAAHAEAAAFADERKMRADPAHPDAFYAPAAWAFAATLRPARDLTALLARLATRAALDRAGAEAAWSPWLAEGLPACFALTAPAAGGLRLRTDARRDAAVVLSLAARNAHVPLHMLVHGGPELFRGPLAPLASREAGLFAAFLLWGNQGKRRDPFLRYLHLERQPGPAPPQTLEATLGTPLKELETQWFDFLQALAR